MCSWNIAGVKDKLQDPDILQFILNFDIVWLLEAKIVSNLSVPGFCLYHNPSQKGKHRGGVLLLVKNNIMKLITNIKLDCEGQIWVQLSCSPGIFFGGVYITPEDSPYFDVLQFGNLEAVINEHEQIFVMGDFNARVGYPNIVDKEGIPYVYENVQDHHVNNNGRKLLDICSHRTLVVMNHLLYEGKIMGGNLSYRKREWVSELDLCIISRECIELIDCLEVNQSIRGSDHAPLSVVLKTGVRNLSFRFLLERAENLGRSYIKPYNNQLIKKSISHNNVDVARFIQCMSQIQPPDVINVERGSIETLISEGVETISKVAEKCKVKGKGVHWNVTKPRWERLLECNDSKVIWRAIDWKGQISEPNTLQPDDSEFKAHFETLLNQDNVNTESEGVSDLDNAPYIPILDDPFTPQELDEALKDMNMNKSYCGLCPGLFVRLPALWLMFFLTMFNTLFLSLNYLLHWGYSKLVVLFKSGDRMVCGNYRGISIMDTLSKIYDILLLNRLKLWFSVDKCQAGAQRKRGCIEQILSLRLLIDLVIFKKKKLYVMFVDFSKAYDRVPRGKMISYLKELGCGKRMLYAIRNMYSNTKNVLRTAVINSSVGVRQGAPTSCLLFVIYMNKMVKMLKDAIPVDNFLGNLHMLLLMDDTVIVATSREMCIKKFDIMMNYCNEYGMQLNDKKSKFFVINKSVEDQVPITVQGQTINYCKHYLYLGTWFTDDGKLKSCLSLHQPNWQSTLNKFTIFCNTNTKMPFYFKKKVFEAAATSSLFYGSEAWLSNDLQKPIINYNLLVKSLLNVRVTTSTYMCLTESGIPPAQFIVSSKRKRFFMSKLSNPDGEEPFHIVYEMCRAANSPGYRFIQTSLVFNDQIDPLGEIILSIRNKPASATKYVTYRDALNPNLRIHRLYTDKLYISDYTRVAFSRLRLMSHSLRIETGRWSRTPPELRVCSCDNITVQDETHVLISCPMSVSCRYKYPSLSYESLIALLNDDNIVDLVKYIHEVLQIYK